MALTKDYRGWWCLLEALAADMRAQRALRGAPESTLRESSAPQTKEKRPWSGL